MALIGYARVSTHDQDARAQVDALTAAGCERIFVDHASGSTQSRPQLAAALDWARSGDTLVVWRLDRLGRSLRNLIDQVEQLHADGIDLRSLTEAIDTSTAGGRLVFHIFAAMAEAEREWIRERTRVGLAAARARGRRGGRPRVMSPERIKVAQQLRADGATLAQIAETLGVGRSTVVRALSAK